MDAMAIAQQRRAYRAGWNASARAGHDLERDEARYLRTHTRVEWEHWSDGWEDYALGHDFSPPELKTPS